VAISSGCAVVDPGFAVLIGGVAPIIYFTVSYFVLNKLHIDDPLDAFAVHGGNGVWGVLAVGVMVNSDFKMQYYSKPVTNLGMQLAVQIIGILAIIGWTCALSFLFFFYYGGILHKKWKEFSTPNGSKRTRKG